ncbi:hypothetical protein PN36_14820 [Candidatus Thiomargarita nelsonii]|uniref:Uncharacterized protein n=1 Tax=Candidatus Thiomargarita nelsonii TaxID=1003181 RepID=A0A0A6P9Y7_9GAMM|nr:hypothetical protein PN36_14820 [Candidatus Thiomargarita nelsonii]
MTSLSSELEKRLRQLENEQNNQNKSLNDLSDFESVVVRLAEKLKEIDNYEFKPSPQQTDFTQLRDTKEIERLEKELVGIDEKTSTSSATSRYIIGLMFNPKSPIEWSGTGWKNKGGGMPYTSEQAQQVFKKLKKQWPNYPLKILKR